LLKITTCAEEVLWTPEAVHVYVLVNLCGVILTYHNSLIITHSVSVLLIYIIAKEQFWIVKIVFSTAFTGL